MRKDTLKLIGACLVLSAVMTGCSSHDPLVRLKSDTQYSDMDNPYWASIEQKQPSVWAQAKTYCFKNSDKPNCDTVVMMATMEGGATEAPAIGHSGQSVSLPTSLDYNHGAEQ